MGITLEPADKEQVHKKFPKLSCDAPNQIIRGLIEFRCWYDAQSGELEKDSQCSDAIVDVYKIDIQFNGRALFGFPQVFETSGKIKQAAIQLGIAQADLHLFNDDSCCLGIVPEYEWRSATDFIEDMVIPFLYWQSHRRIMGEEPWESLPHNTSIAFHEIRKHASQIITWNELNANATCPCGRGIKYKDCHYSSDKQHKFAIWKLREGARRILVAERSMARPSAPTKNTLHKIWSCSRLILRFLRRKN